MSATTEPTTLVGVEEVSALEAEVYRLRAVLENLRDIAGAMAVAADGNTEAVGLAYLGRLASRGLTK